MSESESLERASDPDKQHVIEKDIRCGECNRLITKLSVYVALPAAHSYEGDITISQFFPAIEVKIGLETKCIRCKRMDHKLNVI